MIDIKISEMTGKLKGFQAINTNTLSNEFCSKMRKTDAVCSECYSAAMLQGVRKNCVDPWQKNSDILSAKKYPIDRMPVVMGHSFRFHGHGELINFDHLFNYVGMAIKNPHTTFALWTKRKELIAQYVKEIGAFPDNLILIFSNASTKRVLKKVPKHFHKVFNASKTGNVPEGATECTGKSCASCMACYRINEHKIIVEKVK